MQGLKSANFPIFQTGPVWPCTVSTAQKSLAGFQKLFLSRVPMNLQQCWKAKLKRAYSFTVQSGKITVWVDSSLSVKQIFTKISFNTFKKQFRACEAVLKTFRCMYEKLAIQYSIPLKSASSKETFGVDNVKM